MVSKKYLVIVPARSGSKEIKDKNIIEICGQPLIYYTIKHALRLLKEKKVLKAIVSTDSTKIAKICSSFGMEVPFLRPKKLATDESKSIEFVMHAIKYYEDRNIYFDAVVILQPTSPLRSYDDIINALELFNNVESDSLISLYYDKDLSDLKLYKKNDIFAEPINKDHNKGIRRQEYQKIYVRNGAIFITKVEYLKRSHKIISERPLFFEMPKERSINIDTYEDLEVAKKYLSILNN